MNSKYLLGHTGLGHTGLGLIGSEFTELVKLDSV